MLKPRFVFDSCPTGAVTQHDTLSHAPAGVGGVNSICVTSWHTSERAQSVVCQAGSCRNAHRENEDKEEGDTGILTV